MRSKEYLWEIVLGIYREMYRKATPPADFDELRKKGIVRKKEWFMKYYLDEATQIKILDKYCKGLSKLERHAVETTVWLGCSPTAVKKVGKKGRGKEK